MTASGDGGPDNRRTGRAIRSLEAVHVGALGLWAGALGMTGVTAAIVFPVMKSLEPTLGRYAGYAGEHWMLAAGHVAAPLFGIVKWVQFVCAVVAVVAVAAIFRRIPGKGRWIRAGAVGGAALLAVYFGVILEPRMNANLREYWAGAEAGQSERAGAAREAFGADHPVSSRVIGATLVLVLGAMGAAAAFPAGGRSEPDRPTVGA